MTGYTDLDLFALSELLVPSTCKCGPRRHPADGLGAIQCASARSAARAVLDAGYRSEAAIATLTGFLDELPQGHHERAGVIRAIEVLTHEVRS